ncbi:hypothetical protein HFN80_35660 [Rhizobium laguerreae]|uniref:hypothetical protein n=1 Tax=Rhizobium laguerreae TaxID=1076926 RepID=UPI001C922D83|nr:hypothetical protein [Rhizobium laguerreae]MBY3469239.1 hypothetical protein [Rhizobium laguerreae]
MEQLSVEIHPKKISCFSVLFASFIVAVFAFPASMVLAALLLLPAIPPLIFLFPRKQRIARLSDKTAITLDRLVHYIEDGDIAYIYEDPSLIVLQMKSDLNTFSYGLITVRRNRIIFRKAYMNERIELSKLFETVRAPRKQFVASQILYYIGF